MHRKKFDSESDERQLPLPFDNCQSRQIENTSQDNIVCLSTRMVDKNVRVDKESRKRSIRRLIKYAERLDW